MKNEELIEKAQELLRFEGISSTQWKNLSVRIAEFAEECIKEEKERTDKLKQECDHIYERLSWILSACTLDRDAKNEIEELLK